MTATASEGIATPSGHEPDPKGHFGRYGGQSESNQLSPLYLGEGTLVRGYNVNSFDVRSSSGSGVPNGGSLRKECTTPCHTRRYVPPISATLSCGYMSGPESTRTVPRILHPAARPPGRSRRRVWPRTTPWATYRQSASREMER